ncbi:hypothetical protein [Bifidobacterium sp. UBA744]|uniref:hypothetical protein n=1 Tax=Bifidobacterium sp. UBA744 TaxID=1946112 RepID=UPI0025BF24A5|nr:hypothetical protein [Bifidobacterium sp. UBA744]
MSDQNQNTSRHAAVMRGVVTPIFGLLAVAAIVFGVLNATEWKPSAEVNATADTSTRYVVADPGVLSVVDNQVDMTVSSSSNAKICVATGTSQDVAGWIAGHTYTRLTGLSSWTQLGVEQTKASGDATSAEGDVTLEQSDLWQSVTCGTGSVRLQRDSDTDGGAAVFIDTNADASADDEAGSPMTVALHWTRDTVPDYATPLYFIGGLLIVAAVLSASLFAVHPTKRRKKESGAAPARGHEEIKLTIPQLVAGAFGKFFGAIASMLHIGKRPHRRHARRAGSVASSAVETSSLASTATVPAAPTVVDVTARNLVAEQAVQSSQAARSDEPPMMDDSPNDEETSVISPDELQAYIERLNRESAASGDAANKQGEE